MFMHASGSRLSALPVLVISIFLTTIAVAQSYIYDPGRPPYTTSIPVELGFVNVANGNLHLEIPIGSPLPQRGLPPFAASMVYDSRIWTPAGTWSPSNVKDIGKSTNGNLVSSQGGWRLITTADPGVVSFSSSSDQCLDGHGFITYRNSFAWYAP